MSDRFKNREPEFPGRVRITKVPGSTDQYYIEKDEGRVSGFDGSRELREGTLLDAETLNNFEEDIMSAIASRDSGGSQSVIKLSTSTTASTAAKAFGNTAEAIKAGDEFELTFITGNTAEVPTAMINGTTYSFRMGGNAVSGPTLKLGNGAKVRCFWDGTYLQLYGTQAVITAANINAIPSGDKGAANGVAPLGGDGKVPAANLAKASSVAYGVSKVWQSGTTLYIQTN